MTLDNARITILAALGRMDSAYTQPVFDEWVLVSIKPDRGTILAYQGPRAESYKQTFAFDIRPLRTELEQQKLAVGDFAFATSASGAKHDACMRIGETSFFFCNHTAKTMADIRQNPLWLEAQKSFVKLSEMFRTDPVV